MGTGSSRCYALEGSAKICRTNGKLNSTTCLLRNAMCVETVCGAKGGLSAVFRFQDGKDVSVPCPSGADSAVFSLRHLVMHLKRAD